MLLADFIEDAGEPQSGDSPRDQVSAGIYCLSAKRIVNESGDHCPNPNSNIRILEGFAEGAVIEQETPCWLTSWKSTKADTFIY